MTRTEALAILQGPLVFGDPAQIEALQKSRTVSLEVILSLRPCKERLSVLLKGLKCRGWGTDSIPLYVIEEINGPQDLQWVLKNLPPDEEET